MIRSATPFLGHCNDAHFRSILFKRTSLTMARSTLFSSAGNLRVYFSTNLTMSMELRGNQTEPILEKLPSSGVYISQNKMDEKGLSASVVYVTVSNLEEAKNIARYLVENKLVACVNIVPNITSVYSWEGKVCEDNELLLIMKIPNDQLEAAQKAVKDLHSYDTPEFISLPIVGGSLNYLQWLANSKK